MIRSRCLLVVFALVIVSTLSAVGATPPSQTTATAVPSGQVVARIYFQSAAQLAELTSTLDVWEVHRAQGFIVARIDPVRYVLLTGQGYAIEIDEAKTAGLSEVRVPLPGQVNAIPGYPCYRTVEETYATYDTLISTYPNLITKQDIGDSWDKLTAGGPAGYDIWVLKLTNSATPGPKPRFFLMAEIHAREYTTAETATRFMEYLLQGYGTDPDITWLLDTCEIHVVPMSNPDGRKFAEGGDLWRKNTDNDDGCTISGEYGTDLNRNHSFKWNQGGSSGAPCDELYHGPTAASEPEVQAIQSYVMSIFADQRGPGDSDAAPVDTTGMLITLHSYSELILWPWGFTSSPAPNGTALQTLGRKLAFFNSYTPQQSVDLYPTSGSSEDWSYGELGIAGYTFEMGNSFFEGCSAFTSTIWPTNRNSLLYAFKASRRPYQTPAGPEPINVTVTPPGVMVGGSVTLTATVDDTRYRSGTGEPTQNVAAAQWMVDAPSFVPGTATAPMSASDGAFNSPVEGVQATVSTVGWTPGRHLLLVEGKDALNNWGVPSAAFVCVSQAASSVGLSPTTDGKSGNPGADVVYTLTVSNLGASAEVFFVALSGNTWSSSAPTSIGPLAPCATATLQVTVTIPAGAQSCATDTVTVTVTSAGNSAAATLATTVNPAAGQPITAPASVCALTGGHTASIPDAGAGATYTWTITGGHITAGADTNAITFTAGGSGSVSLKVLVGQGALCFLSGPKTVEIVAPPTVAITGATSLCSGSTLTLTATGTGLTSYAWSKDNVPIPDATSATYQKVGVTTADAGTYRVTVTNAAGCQTVSSPVPVVIASEPSASIGDAAVLEGNSGTTSAVLTVTLSVPACIEASVSYQTVAGTATAGVDFQAVSGTLTFPVGQRTQTITVPVVGDRVAELDETFQVVLSGPTNMAIVGGEATGSILNDDTPGVTVTPTAGLTTTENATTATFKVTLTSQPTADVAVALTSGDLTEGLVTPSVTLTAANWTTGVTATVTGVDDYVIDGSQTFTVLTAPATSVDPFYVGIDASDVTVVNGDNDAAGFFVSPSSGLKTTEDGGKAYFVVALTCQPTADVTLGLQVSLPSEAQMTPTSITFHPGDWSIPRLVTLTGLNDGTPRSYSVLTAAATSADVSFQGLNPTDVSVTNLGTGIGTTERVGLAVDEHTGGFSASNLNGVFEAGETVILEPTWRNTRPTNRTPLGELGAFTGPQAAGNRYRTIGTYPTLAPGEAGSCYNAANPQSCYALRLRLPVARPSRHWDVRIDETVDTIPTTWTLHIGESFTDVAKNHWAYRFVETIFHNGITSGCGPTTYCPTLSLTRAEMAVLLLMAKHGSTYVPPLSTGTVFTDVPIDHWAGDFIEALAAEGITSGCATGLYCPASPITRAEMAVFLLAAEHGTGWTPPAPTGTVFTDVPASHWAAAFIEALAAEGITGGCDASRFCPASPVTRAEMAVFLTATFELKLY